ncbi:hypothetical protein Droror1_Dr00016504, partial [Drosera rotundifolia]
MTYSSGNQDKDGTAPKIPYAEGCAFALLVWVYEHLKGIILRPTKNVSIPRMFRWLDKHAPSPLEATLELLSQVKTHEIVELYPNSDETEKLLIKPPAPQLVNDDELEMEDKERNDDELERKDDKHESEEGDEKKGDKYEERNDNEPWNADDDDDMEGSEVEIEERKYDGPDEENDDDEKVDAHECPNEWKDVMETLMNISQEKHEEEAVQESMDTEGVPMDLAEDVPEREIVRRLRFIGSITEAVTKRTIQGRIRENFLEGLPLLSGVGLTK